MDDTLYYLNDANMNPPSPAGSGETSVTAVVDGSDGDVVERYAYDPYGKVTVLNGEDDADGGGASDWSADADNESDWDNRLGYCGYRLDPETGADGQGIMHVRWRPYLPPLGRWGSRDPLGYVDGVGLYAYVRNSPTHGTDPAGLKLVFPEWVKAKKVQQELRSREERTDEEEAKLAAQEAVVNSYGELIAQLEKLCKAFEGKLSIDDEGVLLLAGEHKREGMTETACCCLHDLIHSDFAYNVYTDAGTRNPAWREGEEVPKYIGPHNSPTEFHLYHRGRPWPRRGKNVVDTGRDSFQIHVPVGSRSEWEYGNYDAKGKARKAPHWRVTAHELCGHAWKEHHQTGGRMPLDILHINDRGRPMFEQPGRRPHHDRAVDVENEIARQVDPEGEGKHPRPLYDQHDLHGESLGRDKDGQWDVKTDPQTGEAYPKPEAWINE